MNTTIPEFRAAKGFAFQNAFQTDEETCAYHKTLDEALNEIDQSTNAIQHKSRAAIPNPSGISFKSDIIATLVENLRLHEMPEGGLLWYRIYDAAEPVYGLRIEFWGAGIHPLPSALTAKKWFTRSNPPWDIGVIPHDILLADGYHTVFQELFYSGEYDYLDEVMHLGWRKANEQEGPLPNGHVIAAHFRLESTSS